MKKLSDRALQSLRNAGNEAEEAADEIEALRLRIAELEAKIASGQEPADLDQIIDAYLEGYVFEGGDDGSHTPNEGERLVIKDAFLGLLGDPDWDAAWRKVIGEQAQLASGQEPVAWQTFDGEGGYEFRQFAENETYHDDYIKRNGEKYSAWVTPLYTHPAPAQHPLSKSDAVDAARYRYCLQHGWPECRRQIHPTVEALHWGYEDGSQYPSPTAAIDAAAMLASKDGSGMWCLGEIDGCWREIDFWSRKANASHPGVLRIVWQFEGEGESNYCQTFAASVVDLLNRTAPAQQPLRRDEVADLHEETEPLCSLYTFRDIVADIEAKHGIKEKP
jgi:hypothetical protein